MVKFNPTTPFAVYVKESSYVSGQGHESQWERLETIFKPATDKTPEQKTGVFYCHWKGAYGRELLDAQSLGVSDTATLRTFFNPELYKALCTKEAVIIKNAGEDCLIEGNPNKEDPNTYELWGGVDNINQDNQYMEFRVRRYEGK